jgi:general secretion pathway protein D
MTTLYYILVLLFGTLSANSGSKDIGIVQDQYLIAQAKTKNFTSPHKKTEISEKKAGAKTKDRPSRGKLPKLKKSMKHRTSPRDVQTGTAAHRMKALQSKGVPRGGSSHKGKRSYDPRKEDAELDFKRRAADRRKDRPDRYDSKNKRPSWEERNRGEEKGPRGAFKSRSKFTDVNKTSEKDKSDIQITEKDKKCKPLPPYVRVSMNFNEAEILEIVQWISEQTCKNFIIGDSIRGGKITILSNTPVTANEAYRAFLSALNVNNMTIVKTGRFYKIQMKRDAAKDTIPTYIGKEGEIPSLDQMITHVMQLKYVDANTINGTIKQLITKDGQCFPYAPTNTLIISDTGSNLHRIKEIIEQLDTPLGQEEIRIIKVEFAIASELAATLEEIFAEKGGAKRGAASSRIKPVRPGKGTKREPPSGEDPASAEGDGMVTISKIISDDRTNQIILVASARSFPQILEIKNKLDVPIDDVDGEIHVVYLEYADAEELSSTISSLAQGSSGRAASRKGGGGKRAGGTQRAAELFKGEVKVTADKGTNSLVIVASKHDYKSLLRVIKELDIARRQVFVEAIIMEINLDTTKDTGLAFHGGSAADIGGETVPLFFGTNFKNFNSLVPDITTLGFLAGLQGPELSSDESILGSIALPSFGVMLKALQTDSNVNVLSTPHVLTSDNEEAEIKVVENIPIPAGYGGGMGRGLGSLSGLASMASGVSGTSGLGNISSYGLGGLMGGYGMGAINREEVGLTLKIKPQINKGNVIRMELEEELSEVKDTSNPLGPTTTKRSAKTVVEVDDQQTIVIGGLMREKIDVGETKVPILGDIPVLGWLFRTRRQQKTKTNLLLFITPYVIEDRQDFKEIYERKVEERREFVETFYGKGPEYKAFIDFRKRRGPFSDIHVTLHAELLKIENGGPGSGRDIIVTPKGVQNSNEKSEALETEKSSDPQSNTDNKQPQTHQVEVE